MFFKPKPQGRKGRGGGTPTASHTMSPRFARLVRESRWLVVVALFLWLALILATYARHDRAFSTTGDGGPILNRGGIAGAWLSDLLLYLFGLSAWWWVIAGVVLVVAGYRRIREPELATGHPLPLATLGFALVLLSSAAVEHLRFTHVPAALPQNPGGVFGDVIGGGFAKLLGFNGATLLLLVAFAVGWSLFSGMSWLNVMERMGGWIETTLVRLRKRVEEHADRKAGDEAAAQREAIVQQVKLETQDHEPVVVVPAVIDVPKSERVI